MQPKQSRSTNILFFLLLITPIYAFIQSCAHGVAGVVYLWRADVVRSADHLEIALVMFGVTVVVGAMFALYARHSERKG